MWRHIGHANNMVYLPNGRIAFVDTTPPVVDGKTPLEDLEALNWKNPPEKNSSQQKDEKDDFGKMLAVSLKYGIPAVGGMTLALGLFELHRGLKTKRILRQFKHLAKTATDKNRFDPLEQRILGAVTAHIGLLSFTDPDESAG